MTLAKAKALAADLLDAGCRVQLEQHPISGDWIVEASRPGNPVTPAQIVSLATTHVVTALTDRARFS